MKTAKHFCCNYVRKYFFNNRVVDAWNSLSNNVVLSPSVGIFKKRLRTVNRGRFMTITVSAIYLALWLLFTLCMFELHYSVDLNKLNDDDDDICRNWFMDVIFCRIVHAYSCFILFYCIVCLYETSLQCFARNHSAI